MNEVAIIDAVRTPIARRNGGLSTMHSVDLLASVQKVLLSRTGIEPSEVGMVVGGCVLQAGMQAFNVTRNAWLATGFPLGVAAFTIDSQCGSSQQAVNVAASLVASGATDITVACGVEMMSRVPLGSTVTDATLGPPVSRQYAARYEFTSQFEGGERIAERWGITRADCDEYGKLSQDRAAMAWAENRFGRQVVPIDAPDLDADGEPIGTTHRVERDEGLRATTLEGLAGLKPTGRPDGVHTAGTSSQIADGAGAVLLMRRDKADALGLPIRATIVDSCLVGSDPELMLIGPIPATETLLAKNKMTMDDIDIVEINEAFASVVLAWQRETGADTARVNPNGGAIAMGHPLGATGAILVAKAVDELVRADKELALVTMCCGGGLGTGTLLRRG